MVTVGAEAKSAHLTTTSVLERPIYDHKCDHKCEFTVQDHSGTATAGR